MTKATKNSKIVVTAIGLRLGTRFLVKGKRADVLKKIKVHRANQSWISFEVASSYDARAEFTPLDVDPFELVVVGAEENLPETMPITERGSGSSMRAVPSSQRQIAQVGT